MKYLLTIITLFCTQIILSQNTSENDKRFSIGIVLSPQFSNWQHKTTPEYQWLVDLSDSIYTEKNGLSFGIISEYQINNKFSLNFGLQSSYYAWETIILTYNVEDPLIPCGRGSLSGSDHYIDIPVVLKYNILSGDRLSFFIGAGLVNKFLFYKRVRTFSECYDNKELISKSCKVVDHFSYYLSASLQAGIDISVTERIYAGIYPSFEYSLFNLKKDNEITRQYSLVGINLSLLYSL